MLQDQNALYFVANPDCDIPEDTRQCQLLWTAVIRRGIQDYVSYKNDANTKLRRLSLEAKAWLYGDDEMDFVECCHAAGLNPDTIRSLVRQLRKADMDRSRSVTEW